MKYNIQNEYKPNLAEVIERYKAFWNKDKLDRIPIRIRFPVGSLQAHEIYLEKSVEEISKSEKKWEDVALNSKDYFEYWEEIIKARSELLDDGIPTAPVDLGPAIMGGVMGAEIKFENGTSWSTHPLKDWHDADNYYFDHEGKWIKKIEEMTKYFLMNSKGKFAVGSPLFMGPGDTLICLRGPTETCIDFYEYSEEIRKLIEKCFKAYIETVNYQFSLVPEYYGGTCDDYDIWTPGRSRYLTSDISAFLSPKIYREFLFEYDQRTIDSLDNCCWMHTHSSAYFMVPEFLKLKGLKGVQIVSDKPAGPTIDEVLPVMKKIQDNHCLILRKYDIEEIKKILPELSPRGLFIDTQCSSLVEAKMLLEEWDVFTRKL